VVAEPDLALLDLGDPGASVLPLLQHSLGARGEGLASDKKTDHGFLEQVLPDEHLDDIGPDLAMSSSVTS